MKKILLSLLIVCLFVIVGGLFVLPYGLGFMAHNKYMQLLDVFGKSNTLQVTLVDYKRGWFSSEATIKITLPQQQMIHNTDAWVVKQHIEHGPIFSVMSPEGAQHAVLGQGLITAHARTAVGVIDGVSWIKLNGGLTGAISTAALHYVDTQDNQPIATLSLNAVSGTFKLSADAKHFVGSLQIPQTVLAAGKSTQEINQIKFDCDLRKSDSGLFLGQHSVSVKAVTGSTELIANKAYKMQGFRIDAHEEEKDHKVNSQLNAELKDITFNNASYGPQQFTLVVQGLDAPTLLTLRKRLGELNQQQASFDQMIAAYQELSVTLLRQGLKINIQRLKMATPWGDPSLTATFIMPAQATNNRDDLMKAAQITAEANIPAPFLVRVMEEISGLLSGLSGGSKGVNTSQQIQQEITALVNNKWLLPAGNGYQTTFVYQNQQMTLNGQSID